MTRTPKPTSETRRDAAIRRLRAEIEKLAGMPCERKAARFVLFCCEAFPGDVEGKWCWPCYCQHLLSRRQQ